VKLLDIIGFVCGLAVAAQAEDKFTIATAAPHNRQVEFVYRLPSAIPPERITAIMVVFGGRNWDGAAALKRLDFTALADRFGLALLAPGFKDDDYWEPQKWSGHALDAALRELTRRCHIKDYKLLYYGYSAGGQCANLFYAWQPERVIAWGAHGCGVWCDPAKITNPCPALITCGIQDQDRWEISRNFVQRAGELGWRRTWCDLPGDHDFPPVALQLAEAFFTAVLNNDKPIYWGDDQTGKVTAEVRRIEPELRSWLPGTALKNQWLKMMEQR